MAPSKLTATTTPQTIHQDSLPVRLGSFLGLMACSLCAAEGKRPTLSAWSQENLFVPGSNVVYTAPGGIVHYVESHAYLPPGDLTKLWG